MENDIISELTRWQADLMNVAVTINNMVELANRHMLAGSEKEERDLFGSIVTDLNDIREDYDVKMPEGLVDALQELAEIHYGKVRS